MNKLWAFMTVFWFVSAVFVIDNGFMVCGAGLLGLGIGSAIAYPMGVEATLRRLKK